MKRFYIYLILFILLTVQTFAGSPTTSPIGGNQVSNDVYSSKWNGVTGVAPSKNTVYDKIQSVISGGHNPVTLSSDLLNNLLGISTQLISLDNQNSNLIFAGPTTGAAAAPSFRSLVNADIPNTLTPTFAGVTTPTVIGGTGTTSDLNLQTTSGVGATGADMHFKVGNNGATEAATILNNGNMGLNTVAPSARLTLNYGGFGDQATPPTTGYYGLLLENNTTVASAVRESPPWLYFKGHGWTGAADQICEASIGLDTGIDGYPYLKFLVREGGTGAWNSALSVGNAFVDTFYPFRNYGNNLGETVTHGLHLINIAAATVATDQYAPCILQRSAAWKTAATAGSQMMSSAWCATPQTGTISPVGILKLLYGINSATVTESDELVRFQFGTDAGITGVVFNDVSANDYTLRVEGATDANLLMVNGTNDRVGIGVATPTAQLHTSGTVRMANFGAGTATFDANGNISSVSDERLKDIQGAYDIGINELMNIDPILFKFNGKSGLDTENIYAGFSAQNIQEFIPYATGKDSDGYYTVIERPILAALVNAVKDLQNQINELKTALGIANKDVETVWHIAGETKTICNSAIRDKTVETIASEKAEIKRIAAEKAEAELAILKAKDEAAKLKEMEEVK